MKQNYNEFFFISAHFLLLNACPAFYGSSSYPSFFKISFTLIGGIKPLGTVNSFFFNHRFSVLMLIPRNRANSVLVLGNGFLPIGFLFSLFKGIGYTRVWACNLGILQAFCAIILSPLRGFWALCAIPNLNTNH